MSKMMIYALLGTIGGATENVWGHQMQVDTIDPTDKDAVEKAKADGWTNKPQDVIEQIEVKKMQSQNAVMKEKVDASLDSAMKKRIEGLELDNAKLNEWCDELTEQNELHLTTIRELRAGNKKQDTELAGALTEQAKLESEVKHLKAKLDVYEKPKDTNSDGQISYDEMTKDELQVLLDQRKVEYVARDSKDVLIQKAKDSE